MPLQLIQLADPTISEDHKQGLRDKFLAMCDCELDSAIAAPLRSAIAGPAAEDRLQEFSEGLLKALAQYGHATNMGLDWDPQAPPNYHNACVGDRQ